MPAKPSPFPGMDPYIEPVWGPFHNDYIGQLRRQLAAQLPDDLYALVEADVYVVEGDAGPPRSFRPDAAAFAEAERPPAAAGRPVANGASAVAEPVRVRVQRSPLALSQVSIRESRQGHRLVTAVELFSPKNKPTDRDRNLYRDKRDAYLMASANVVEIDLLRGGADLMDLMDLAGGDLPPMSGTTFRACVRYADPDVGDQADFYPMPLREPLPRIAVPLRPGDNAVVLDLQRAVVDVYARNRYGVQIDYAVPPDPLLSPPDAAWAAERIAAANGRGVPAV